MRCITLRWAGSFLALALTLAAAPSAHHSMTMFQRDKPTTIQGRVARFEWRNPHAMIFVETNEPSGEVVTWTIETVYTALLMRSGWTKDTLQIGEQITVNVNPVADPKAHFANLNFVTKADGTILRPNPPTAGGGQGNLPPPVEN